MKSSKVCTVTFHTSYNYGAVLQTCALRKKVEELGYACDVLDYVPPFREPFFFERAKLFHRRSHPFLSVCYYILNSVILKKKRALRFQRFRDFMEKEYHLSAGKYKNCEDLRTGTNEYDTFICGSDQIWNTGNYQADDGFFLNFVPDGKKKIAYAPSFGVNDLEEKSVDFVKKSLVSFHALSTRESQGKKIISKYLERDSEVVLDPTFLISREKWMELASPYPINRPYILCYFIHYSPQLIRLANAIKKKTGYPIYCIDRNGETFFRSEVNSIYDAGPREFLTLIDNAAIVLTSSFHGTAFSINFNKPFVTQLRSSKDEKKSVNSRVLDLFARLNISNRVFHDQLMDQTDVLTMDYESVNQELMREREHSTGFLKTALEQ
ncbi:MAG: polysaccharide pyruvyl transferase family protein [Planctomycetaceae bacterium]|nr:polysaccharide pyruvyl transferase family protein [Planctomycetaceae bacterium]